MADIRSIAGRSLIPQAEPVARAQSVRAAQRAFFQAALSGAPSPPAAAAQAAPSISARGPVAAPDRTLRPGSLVDIKV